MAFSLLDLVVSFSAKGLELVTDALTKVSSKAAAAGAAMTDLSSAAGAASAALTATTTGMSTLSRASDVLQGALQKIAAGMGLSVVSLNGLAAAGVATSAMGQALSFQLEMLSRTVAGLFGPEIRKVIELVRDLTVKLQQLSDAQKTNLAYWLQGASVATALGTALTAMFGPLVGILGGLAAGLLVAQDGLGGLFTQLRPLLDVLKDFGAQLMEAFAPLQAVGTELFGSLVAAIKPLLSAVGSIAVALAPVVKMLMELASGVLKLVALNLQMVAMWVNVFLAALAPVLDVLKILSDVLVTSFAILGDYLQRTLKLLAPFEDMLKKLAKTVMTVVLTPLRMLAEVLNLIAKGMASVLGIDLSKKEKPEQAASPGRGPAAPRAGGFEAITAAYDRITQASLAASFGKSPQEITNDLLGNANEKLDGIKTAIDNKPPAVRM